MAREKWQLILNKGHQQGKVFTKAEVNEWLRPFYYGGLSEGDASQILTRMVTDGCIKRIKKGTYKVMRSPKPMGGKKAASVSMDAAQQSLF